MSMTTTVLLIFAKNSRPRKPKAFKGYKQHTLLQTH